MLSMRRVRPLCLLLACLWGSTAQAVKLNLQDANILEVIKMLSDLTGKTFVPNDALASLKITIVSSPDKDMSVEQAYLTFQTYLRSKGFATVESNNVVRIVPIGDAKSEGPRTVIGDVSKLEGEGFVTLIQFLRHGSAESLANVLRSLVSANGLVLVEGSSNALILTDTADNVRRFRRIIEALDIEGSRRQLEVFFLQHASADTLARTLGSVLEKETRADAGGAAAGNVVMQGNVSFTGAPAPALSVIAEPRTNALIAFGTQEQLGLLAMLLKKLDVPGTVERAALHVYSLKHAKAKELAEILTAQVKAVASAGEGTGAAAAAGDAAQQQRPTQVVGEFQSKVTVTADPSTNSLVIAATPEDYEALQTVIEQLDRRRTQVHVEALILEATAGAAQKIGVELRFPTDPNDGGLAPIGGTTFPVGNDPSSLGQLIQNPLSPAGGLLVGAIDGTISFNGQEVLNIAGLARALQSDNSFNVLSSPYQTTLDNEEAEIVVGEERPFLRSQQSTEVGTLLNTFDFKDIGIKLKFTPHVGVGDTVRLDLAVEITNFLAEAQGTVGAVTTTKRSVKTAVLVDSGQMAVIGGLMQDSQDRATARVPCLGSLPLVGWAFKSSSKERRKTNLLIFVEPRILPDRDSLEQLRQQKTDSFEGSKPKERSLKDDLKDLLEQMETRPPQ